MSRRVPGLGGIVVLGLLFPLACQGPPPESMADCEAISSPQSREECRYTLVLPLLDNEVALNSALAVISDPGSHDLLLLRLAITRPDLGPQLCAKTLTAAAREKCQQVVGRPHLQTHRRPPKPPE